MMLCTFVQILLIALLGWEACEVMYVSMYAFFILKVKCFMLSEITLVTLLWSINAENYKLLSQWMVEAF